jgi:hypothetical protein
MMGVANLPRYRRRFTGIITGPTDQPKFGARQPHGGPMSSDGLPILPRGLTMVSEFFPPPQRHDGLITTDAKRRKMRADRVSDVGRR